MSDCVLDVPSCNPSHKRAAAVSSRRSERRSMSVRVQSEVQLREVSSVRVVVWLGILLLLAGFVTVAPRGSTAGGAAHRNVPLGGGGGLVITPGYQPEQESTRAEQRSSACSWAQSYWAPGSSSSSSPAESKRPRRGGGTVRLRECTRSRDGAERGDRAATQRPGRQDPAPGGTDPPASSRTGCRAAGSARAVRSRRPEHIRARDGVIDAAVVELHAELEHPVHHAQVPEVEAGRRRFGSELDRPIHRDRTVDAGMQPNVHVGDALAGRVEVEGDPHAACRRHVEVHPEARAVDGAPLRTVVRGVVHLVTAAARGYCCRRPRRERQPPPPRQDTERAPNGPNDGRHTTSRLLSTGCPRDATRIRRERLGGYAQHGGAGGVTVPAPALRHRWRRRAHPQRTRRDVLASSRCAIGAPRSAAVSSASHQASGTQLPWKPKGTRRSRWTVATGPAARSCAWVMVRALVSWPPS